MFVSRHPRFFYPFEGLPLGQKWWFLQFFQSLGYRQHENEGYCVGISYMAMQAIQAKEFSKFKSRLQFIHGIVMKARLAALQELMNISLFDLDLEADELPLDQAQISRLPPLIADKIREEMTVLLQEERIDIQAFCDGAELYQNIRLFSKLFYNQEPLPCGLPKQMPHQILHVAMPAKFGNDGLAVIDRFSGTYTTDEFIIYIESLYPLLTQNVLLKDPISFTLQSGIHCICIGYDFEKNHWLFINNAEILEITNRKEIAVRAYAALTKNQFLVMTTHLYTSSEQLNNAKALVNTWKKKTEWETLHQVSAEKAKRKDSHGFTWLCLAAQFGDAKLVDELLAHGADVKVTVKAEVPTPIGFSFMNGHVDILKTLLAEEGFFRRHKNMLAMTFTIPLTLLGVWPGFLPAATMSLLGAAGISFFANKKDKEIINETAQRQKLIADINENLRLGRNAP